MNGWIHISQLHHIEADKNKFSVVQNHYHTHSKQKKHFAEACWVLLLLLLIDFVGKICWLDHLFFMTLYQNL
jgi:hypothetical protein